jgi:hypothetical protein
MHVVTAIQCVNSFSLESIFQEFWRANGYIVCGAAQGLCSACSTAKADQPIWRIDIKAFVALRLVLTTNLNISVS